MRLPAKFINIGHPQGCMKAITIGTYEGKEGDGFAVLSRGATCPGNSGGLVLPLAATEKRAGDGRPGEHRYAHSGAVDSDLGVTTNYAF